MLGEQSPVSLECAAEPHHGDECGKRSARQKRECDPFGLKLGDSDPYLNHTEPDYAALPGGSFYRRLGSAAGRTLLTKKCHEYIMVMSDGR